MPTESSALLMCYRAAFAHAAPEASLSQLRMRQTKSKPNVFIVESLTFEDERRGRLEGEVLQRMLKLSNKTSAYRYIRTTQELREVLKQFGASGMRYLHISCHGDADGLATTLDDLPFQEFGELVRPYLSRRRLFVSACEAASPKLARHILSDSGCTSVVVPEGKIRFDDAAVVWAAFYHLMFRHDRARMINETIRRVLRDIYRVFGVGMRLYTPSKKRPGFHEEIISQPDGIG